jgi:short-subunit dehydrogenase involved in D-alanine esterification of teichoic acids
MLFVFCFNRANNVEELEAVSQQLLQTNVVGNIHLFNLFLPLILKGKVKKVIAISTGLADLDLTTELEINTAPLYAASKASLNVIVAKFNAQYKRDGVLFLSISPGLVEVGRYMNGKLFSSLLVFSVAVQNFATCLATILN